MTVPELHTGAAAWADDFGLALLNHDQDALESMFLEQSYLRDNGALTWDYRQFHGREEVIAALFAVSDTIQPKNFRLAAAWPAPHLSGEGDSAAIEVFLDFDTAFGTGLALVSAVPDPESPHGFRALAVYTRLESLAFASGPEVHPRGYGYEPQFPGQTWAQHRDSQRAYVDHDPEVLVIGGGQAGLVAAAYLKSLQVDVLVVDRNERVGDNWRNRYDSLTLHNVLEMNEFPFLQYPEHYPEYLSKDQLGDWLEIYSRFLDLNVWTSTDFEGAEYHEAEGTWTASLRRADGTPRVLHPRHVILATGGIGGKPSIPQIPTLSQFAGEVLHSSAYTRASDVGTNKAIIIGAATSAHDIAEDLYKNGVDVTILQRGPVVVNDIETANLATAAYLDPETPTELVDVRYGIGLINPLREAWSKGYHEFARERDAELLNGLRAAGMVLGDGHNGQGWLDLFLRTGGGYYLNKGASEIIVAGGITVAQFNDVDHFVDSGVQMADGTIIEADVIILATGFQNRRVEVAEWFGVEVAEKVGDIARLDDEGEWANVWSQTGQRGLWFNGGGINQVRSGTPRLAMFVKADLEGVIPDSFRRPPRTSGTKARFDAGVLS